MRSSRHTLNVPWFLLRNVDHVKLLELVAGVLRVPHALQSVQAYCLYQTVGGAHLEQLAGPGDVIEPAPEPLGHQRIQDGI